MKLKQLLSLLRGELPLPPEFNTSPHSKGINFFHKFILFAVGSNTPPFRAVRFGNANKKW
jgi:hypothetical protein